MLKDKRARNILRILISALKYTTAIVCKYYKYYYSRIHPCNCSLKFNTTTNMGKDRSCTIRYYYYHLHLLKEGARRGAAAGAEPSYHKHV